LVVHNSVVGLLKDRDQEIKHDDQHEEDLDEPHHPDEDQVDVVAEVVLSADQHCVFRQANFTDGRPESLQQNLLKLAHVLNLIVLCIYLHCEHHKGNTKHKQENEVESNERHQVHAAYDDDLHQESIFFKNP
jgi:hypothetical protein